jgi:lipid II:glycine glycyltransferase (peptidoglycan interpeptide bridge formation enzyme)
MGDIKDHYMLDSYFKDDELLFIDIVPSIFSKVIHEFELLSENDNRDLYPMIKEITEKFEDELTEVLDSRLDPPTLVIKFRRLTKLISKEVFEEEGTPFNYRASK